MSISRSPHSFCVRLKGVPHRASVHDIVSFFHGLDLNENCIQLKERRGAGEALVVFKTPEDARRACDRDQEFLLPDRFVRVILVDELTHEEQLFVSGAITSQIHYHKTVEPLCEDTVIKVQGLPPNITVPQEVVQLFWGTRATPAGTVILRDPTKQLAHAFVDMGSAEHAQHVAATWNGTEVTTQTGLYTLKVELASRSQWKEAAARTSSSHSAFKIGEEDAVLKVHGLPLKSSSSDVASFFDGFKTKTIFIHPISEDRNSRVAYVEFENVEEADRALGKDGRFLGGAFPKSSCSLQRVSRQEMVEDIARFVASTKGHSAPSRTTTTSTSSLQYTGFTSNSTGGSRRTAATAAHRHHRQPHSNNAGRSAAPTHSNIGGGAGGGGNGFYPSHYTAVTLAAAQMPPPPSHPQQQQQQLMMMQWAQMAPFFGYPPPQMMAYPGLMPQIPTAAAAFQQQQQQQAPPPANWSPFAIGMQQQQQQQQHPIATSTARYMVEDLTTGQKIYLDPGFNVHPAPPPSDGVAVAVVAAGGGGGNGGTKKASADPTTGRDGNRDGEMVKNSLEEETHRSGGTKESEGSKEGSAADADDVEKSEDDEEEYEDEEDDEDDDDVEETDEDEANNNDDGGDEMNDAIEEGPSRTAVAPTPPTTINTADGHKRNSMEANLAENERPSKHNAAFGLKK